MTYAAVTFVYNENFNLPIWANYYGNLFGARNLYVVDRGSDDGSTSNLGEVNVIPVPRRPFDEHEKTNFLSFFHASLTSFYDAVVMSDCDEIIVPDPEKYADLNQYLKSFNGEYVNAIGIDVLHIINEEFRFDVSKPVLSQRAYGRFLSAGCKQLLSKVPIKWLPGLHSSNKAPNFDLNLFNFHLKYVDFNTAVARQRINMSTKWSEDSLAQNYGAHHRYDLKRFVHEGFFVPVDVVGHSRLQPFDFVKEVEEMTLRTVNNSDGDYVIPMDMMKYFKIPERFASAF